MSIFDRAKNILTRPKTEWAVIEGETATVSGLFTGYAVILALLPVLGSVIAFALEIGDFRYFGMNYLLVLVIATYLIGLGILYLMGIIADALAPSFDGTKNQISAMKLLVYSATPMWVAGFFGFIPGLSILISLAGFAYAAYLLYLGSSVLMKVPQDKAVGYTAVVIIVWIVLAIFITALIVGAIVTSFIGGAALTGAAMYS